MFGRKNLDAAVASLPANLARSVNKTAKRAQALKDKEQKRRPGTDESNS